MDKNQLVTQRKRKKPNKRKQLSKELNKQLINQLDQSNQICQSNQLDQSDHTDQQMNKDQLLLNFKIGISDDVCYWMVLDTLIHKRFDINDHTYINILGEYTIYNRYRKSMLIVNSYDQNSSIVRFFDIINHENSITKHELGSFKVEDNTKLIKDTMDICITLLEELKTQPEFETFRRIDDDNIRVVNYGDNRFVNLVVSKHIETFKSAHKYVYFYQTKQKINIELEF